MTEPRIAEDENPNPDEVIDDGLGVPPPPEDVTDADVDEAPDEAIVEHKEV